MEGNKATGDNQPPPPHHWHASGTLVGHWEKERERHDRGREEGNDATVDNPQGVPPLGNPTLGFDLSPV
ncbi:hypothetical protein U1Q18_010007, partial [Sarracenia purpurea var. burkii]